MDLHLGGRTAIVTGASAGIGLEIASALVREGANVVGGSRTIFALEELAKEHSVLPVAVDLTAEGGAEHLVQCALARFGDVHILVNNVGVTSIRAGFTSISDSEWQEMLNVNFLTMVRTVRAVIPHMCERGGGCIINIASVSAKQPNAWLPDYGASKAAMVNLSKCLALEYGSHGVRVNCVSPGPIRTRTWDGPGGIGDFLAQRYGMERDAAIAQYIRHERKLPLGEMGTAEEVANMVVMLASDISRHITGVDYFVGDSLGTI